MEDFIAGWNSHPLSTEHNRSPNQLWIEGLNGIFGSGTRIDHEVREPRTEVSYEERFSHKRLLSYFEHHFS